MAGEEKFGYFRLSEGTEGEDGSLSSGCGWLEVLIATDCSSFVCEKSGNVISCYRSGWTWWRGTEEIIKCSEGIKHVWSAADLVLKCEDLAVWLQQRKMKARRISDNQGLEGAAHAGLEERGQMSSRQEVKVEHKVSVDGRKKGNVGFV